MLKNTLNQADNIEIFQSCLLPKIRLSVDLEGRYIGNKSSETFIRTKECESNMLQEARMRMLCSSCSQHFFLISTHKKTQSKICLNILKKKGRTFFLIFLVVPNLLWPLYGSTPTPTILGLLIASCMVCSLYRLVGGNSKGIYSQWASAKWAVWIQTVGSVDSDCSV